MLGLGMGADAKAALEAMRKLQAIIEFNPDGTIIAANENFCGAIGYQLSEIVSQHHCMFVEQAEGRSPGSARQ